jgi:hypothetical protein
MEWWPREIETVSATVPTNAVAGEPLDWVPITTPPAEDAIRINGSPGKLEALARRIPISESFTGSCGHA